MHKLAYLGIQTSRRFQFYSDSLKLGERFISEIWGSPGSRQLLHLQHFPKILKKFRTLLYFDLVGFFSRFWSMIFQKVLQHFDLLSIDLFYSFDTFKWSLPLSSSSLLLHVFKVIFSSGVESFVLPAVAEVACFVFHRYRWFIIPPLRVGFDSLTFRVVFYSSSEGLSSPSSDVADRSSFRESAVTDHVGRWLYLIFRSALWFVFRLRIGAR